MNKLLLVLPLFAGASWAGTTYYSGAQTENAYNRLLEQVNNNSSEVFVLKSAEYKAGFMNSTAITEVHDAQDLEAGAKFKLQHVINHSPVSVVPENARFGAANIVTTLVTDGIEDEKFNEFVEKFDNGVPFVLTTDVAIDGATDSDLVVNSLELEDEDVKIKADGATGKFVTTAAGSVSGNIISKDMVLNEIGGDGSGELKDVSLTFDFAKLDETDPENKLFFDIDFEAKVGEANILDNRSGGDFAMKGARYSYSQNLTGDKPSVKFGMGVENLETDDAPITSLNVESVLDGFSITAMVDNVDFYKDLPTSDNPEQILFSPKGIEILRATFAPNTKLTTDVQVTTVDGDVDANVSLWFAGNGSEDGYTGMVTAGDLAKAFAGTATANADRSAINLTPLGMMLDEPMAQIYLTVTEESVTLNAKLEELLLKLNQQVLPLEMMAGGMLDMPLEMIPDMM